MSAYDYSGCYRCCYIIRRHHHVTEKVNKNRVVCFQKRFAQIDQTRYVFEQRNCIDICTYIHTPIILYNSNISTTLTVTTTILCHIHSFPSFNKCVISISHLKTTLMYCISISSIPPSHKTLGSTKVTKSII